MSWYLLRTDIKRAREALLESQIEEFRLSQSKILILLWIIRSFLIVGTIQSNGNAATSPLTLPQQQEIVEVNLDDEQDARMDTKPKIEDPEIAEFMTLSDDQKKRGKVTGGVCVSLSLYVSVSLSLSLFSVSN